MTLDFFKDNFDVTDSEKTLRHPADVGLIWRKHETRFHLIAFLKLILMHIFVHSKLFIKKTGCMLTCRHLADQV